MVFSISHFPADWWMARSEFKSQAIRSGKSDSLPICLASGNTRFSPRTRAGPFHCRFRVSPYPTPQTRASFDAVRRIPLVLLMTMEKPFLGVGENMCWGGKRGSFDYGDWLPELGKSGGNFIRIWMCSWNCALEWSKESGGEWRSGNYYGVGVYSLDNAWKLDTILDAAERENVSVMLCLGTYGEFNVGGFFNEG